VDIYIWPLAWEIYECVERISGIQGSVNEQRSEGPLPETLVKIKICERIGKNKRH
jgi:hypothetical protein